MLDPFSKDFRPLRDLVRELRSTPSPAVVCRWHLRGENGRKLQVLRVGRMLYTTRDELRSFLNESQGTKSTPAERDVDDQLRSEGLIDVPVKPRKRRLRTATVQ